jgi:hypothetical protein
MNQIDQITAPRNRLVSPDEELEILSLSDKDFAQGIASLIEHMLAKKGKENSGDIFSGMTISGTSEPSLLLEDNSAMGLE